jgi:hypothetical protein
MDLNRSKDLYVYFEKLKRGSLCDIYWRPIPNIMLRLNYVLNRLTSDDQDKLIYLIYHNVLKKISTKDFNIEEARIHYEAIHDIICRFPIPVAERIYYNNLKFKIKSF